MRKQVNVFLSVSIYHYTRAIHQTADLLFEKAVWPNISQFYVVQKPRSTDFEALKNAKCSVGSLTMDTLGPFARVRAGESNSWNPTALYQLLVVNVPRDQDRETRTRIGIQYMSCGWCYRAWGWLTGRQAGRLDKLMIASLYMTMRTWLFSVFSPLSKHVWRGKKTQRHAYYVP